METVLLIALVATMPTMGLFWVFVEFLMQKGGSMQERKAILFEIYRYSICFWSMLLLGFSTFQLAGGLLSNATSPEALMGPGLSVLVSGLFFTVHWFIKNPVKLEQTGS